MSGKFISVIRFKKCQYSVQFKILQIGNVDFIN